VLSTAAACVQILFLLLSLAGILLMLWYLGNAVVQLIRKRFSRRADLAEVSRHGSP
jgi:putative peptide zinc metalloprotease protein